MKEIPDDESSRDLTLRVFRRAPRSAWRQGGADLERMSPAHLSLDSIVDTRAILPIVLKNSNRLTPPVQSRLLTIRTEPSATKVPPCAVPSRLRVLDWAKATPRSRKAVSCALIPWTLACKVSGARAFRSVDRPEGSPIAPVAPPICGNAD